MFPSSDAVFASVPAWARWSGLMLLAPACFVIAWAAARSTARIAGGAIPPSDVTWTEQARRAYLRRVAISWSLLVAIVVCTSIASSYAGPGARSWPRLTALIATLAAIAGVMAARRGVDRLIFGRAVPWRAWLRGIASDAVVRHLTTVCALAAMLAFPTHFGMRAALCIAFVVFSVTACFLGANIALGRALGLVQPASARLAAIVAEAEARTGVRVRAAYQLAMPTANAFAMPLAGCVGVTEPALALLDDEALTLVCAHELGHLAEPKRRSLTRLALALAFLLPLVMEGALFHSSVELIAAAALVALLALVALRRLGRVGEREADEVARRGQLEDSTYARALEQLYRANLTPAVLWGKGGTHPHLYDRMIAAGVTPEYPRPAPPSRARLRLALGASLVIGAAAYLAPWAVATGLRFGARDSERARLVAIAFLGGDAWDLGELARARFVRGDYDGAAALYGAASVQSTANACYPASLALTLMWANRCADADAALRVANARLSAVSSSFESECVQRVNAASGSCNNRTLFQAAR